MILRPNRLFKGSPFCGVRSRVFSRSAAALLPLLIAGCILITEDEVLADVSARIDPQYIASNVYFRSKLECVVSIYESRGLSDDDQVAYEQLNAIDFDDSEYSNWIEVDSFRIWISDESTDLEPFLRRSLGYSSIDARNCFDDNQLLRRAFSQLLSSSRALLSYSEERGAILLYVFGSKRFYIFWGGA